MRMPDRGGAPGGTPELYFTDPDGLVMKLQDTSYCGEPSTKPSRRSAIPRLS